MNSHQLLKRVDSYYSSKIKKYGATPLGVDWNSSESQKTRFFQLAKIINKDSQFSILDYGCGYGAFLEYIRENNLKCKYFGFDISKDMVSAAKKMWAGRQDCFFTSKAGDLKKYDYVIASGIFNVCQSVDPSEWSQYVLDTINQLFKHANKGVAFNILTKYSDPGKMKDNLYYADPEFIFSYCKHNLSRKVSLIHDYELYEFTILIRK